MSIQLSHWHLNLVILRFKSLTKRYKSPATDQIPAELIQAGGYTLRSGIHKLISFIWNNEELPEQRKEPIIGTCLYKRRQ
jgi:hypothetical protein